MAITAQSVIERDDVDGNPNGFTLHINDGKSPPWYFRADSLREKKSWLMRLGHVHAIVKWLDEFERVINQKDKLILILFFIT